LPNVPTHVRTAKDSFITSTLQVWAPVGHQVSKVSSPHIKIT